MTKDTLLEAYLNLGEEKGFRNVSVQDVADSAGIRKASVFYHFKTFEDLKNEAISFGLKDLSKNDFELKTSFSTFREFLFSFFDDLFSSFSVFPVKNLLIMTEEGRNSKDELLKLSRKFALMIKSRITVALDFAVQKGWIETLYTDSFAEVLTPFVRDLLLSENLEDAAEDAVDSFVKILK